LISTNKNYVRGELVKYKVKVFKGEIRWVREGESIHRESDRGDITEFSERGGICCMILVYKKWIDSGAKNIL